MKFKAKSMLAMAVLLSVMSVGTMAEAANFTYRVDEGPEQTWDGVGNLIGTGSKLEVWGGMVQWVVRSMVVTIIMAM